MCKSGVGGMKTAAGFVPDGSEVRPLLIAMTAYDRGDLERCIEAGMTITLPNRYASANCAGSF